MLVFRNAGSFFKQPPSFIRLVAQDGLDHFQLNHRIRISPHPRIHEQIENIFQPARNLVQQILALT